MEQELPKILVVDDEEYSRVYFKGILSQEDYQVSFARDGSEALQRWSSEAFDLIIMDIRMPGIDGMEALKRIRVHGHGHHDHHDLRLWRHGLGH